NMEQPLGHAIGNAVEVAEAIDVLKGNGPTDVRELCIAVAAQMLWLGGAVTNPEDGQSKAKELLDSGAALEKFRQLIEAQGGDAGIVYEPLNLPQPSHKAEVLAEQTGTIARIATRQLGLIASQLGAGRMGAEEVDPTAGIIVLKKVGDHVKSGEPLAILQSKKPISGEVVAKVKACFEFGGVSEKPLILAGFVQ
ncbi:MAG: pyrimidine-nucleoside phosphorylase, partial [Armatimonadetes bacterium]|nr:pyrimidine-nucleoside phosphorylase [Armatimonadota bacterium]